MGCVPRGGAVTVDVPVSLVAAPSALSHFQWAVTMGACGKQPVGGPYLIGAVILRAGAQVSSR